MSTTPPPPFEQSNYDDRDNIMDSPLSSLPNYTHTIIASISRWDEQKLPILAKINTPFISETEAELNVDIDDIVMIEESLDNYWLSGHCDGLEGKIPRSICNAIDDQLSIIPWKQILDDGQSLYACVASFQAQDLENDISFERGDILMSNKQINEHWMFGQRCYNSKISYNQQDSKTVLESEKVGSFPVNHCWLLDHNKIIQICHRATTMPPVGIATPPMSPIDVAPPTMPPIDVAESAIASRSRTTSILSESQQSASGSSINYSALLPTSNSKAPTTITTTTTATATTASSPVPSTSMSSSSRRSDKKLEHRSTIIMELVQSERDYLSDLKTTRDLFFSDRHNAQLLGIDLTEAFGNIDEVIDLGEDLLRSLELHNMSKYDHDKCVGRCFIDVIERFQKVYGDYCKNHDVTIWNKFADKDTRTKYYLKGKLEELQAKTNCYDIPTILIKPVQRLAKYPLLLNELSKATEDTHPDKRDLDEAFKLVTDAATSINELRSRSEITNSKYHNNKQQQRRSHLLSVSGDISDMTSSSDNKQNKGWLSSKFSFHTVKKKTSRLSTRITASLGLVSLTRDEEFERLNETFKLIEKTIKSFLKDLTQFVDHFEHFLISLQQASENVASFYRDQSSQKELEELKKNSKACMNEHFHEFKRVVDRQVINVISHLLQKFQGPKQLISKRADKLLDYDTKTKKMDSCKDVDKRLALREQQIVAKELYESMNRQLIDELPLFNTYTVDIFRNSILVFLKCRRTLISRYAKQATSLLDTPLMLGSSSSRASNISNNMSDIMENFHVKHSMRVGELLEQVSLLPVAVFQTSYQHPIGTASRQASFSSENGRNQTRETSNGTRPTNKFNSGDPNDVIRSTYADADIYRLTQNYSAADVCDLNCNKGDLVGVIQRKHPLGHKNKWFVDNGRIKGLVPQKYLTPADDHIFNGRRQSSYIATSSASNDGSRSSSDCYERQRQLSTLPERSTMSEIRYKQTPDLFSSNQHHQAAFTPHIVPAQVSIDRVSSQASARPISPSASVLSASLENLNFHSRTSSGAAMTGATAPASASDNSDEIKRHTPLNNNLYCANNNNNNNNKNNQGLSIDPPEINIHTVRSGRSSAQSTTFESSEAGSSRCPSGALDGGHYGANYNPFNTNSSTPLKSTTTGLVNDKSSGQTTNKMLSYDTVDIVRPISVASELSAEFDPLRPASVASSQGGTKQSTVGGQLPTTNFSTANVTPTTSVDGVSLKTYVASWPYKASGPNQLDINCDEMLKLLKDCDECGNKEWSFVQTNNGRSGYVPSSYIRLADG